MTFKFLKHDACESPTMLVKQRRKEREREILEMERPLEEALEAAGIPTEALGGLQAPLVHQAARA